MCHKILNGQTTPVSQCTSKGTLDKKVVNEYPEDRKKKYTKKESVPTEPVELLGTPQALPTFIET